VRQTFAGFDWDEANLDKCRKYGVSIAEIEGLFVRPHTVRVDVAHSLVEERLKAIGKTERGRFWFSRSASATASVGSGP
jgi:uncharacterized DUF497 family protein